MTPMIMRKLIVQSKRLFAEGTIPAAFKVSKGLVSPKGVVIVYLERAGEVQTGITVGE